MVSPPSLQSAAINYRIGNNHIATVGKNIDKLRSLCILKVMDKQGRKDSEGFHIQVQHPTDFFQIQIPNNIGHFHSHSDAEDGNGICDNPKRQIFINHNDTFFFFYIHFPLFLNLGLLSERNKPIKVSPIPTEAIHVISSFNTITDVTTVITGTM